MALRIDRSESPVAAVSRWLDGQTRSLSMWCSPQQTTSWLKTSLCGALRRSALSASRAEAKSSFRVTVRPVSSANFLAAKAACLSRRPPDDAGCIVPSMLRAKRERSPKPMLLTHSLWGWHKEVAQNIPVADPSVTPKALEVSSFVGLLLCLALVHSCLLLFEECCEVGLITARRDRM